MTQKNLINIIRFAYRYPLTWHSYTGDRETVEAVCAGVNLGILEVNEFNQFSLRSPSKAKDFLSERA